MTGLKCRRYVLGTIIGLGMVILSACTSNTLSADNTSNYDISKKEKSLREISAESDSSKNSLECDLLYREYQIGSQMESGSVVIPEEVIEESAEKPEAIIVFYNDQILNSIPYEGADLSFCLDKAGWYCFAILEGNQMIDISDKASYFVSTEDSLIMPLN